MTFPKTVTRGVVAASAVSCATGADAAVVFSDTFKPKLRHFLGVAVAAAAVAFGAQANATVVTFASFGGSSPLYTVPSGETLYTDFSSGLPAGASGNGSLYGPSYGTQCSGGNCEAAPGISTTSETAGQFFAVKSGQSETFTFGFAAKDVGVYIGSLDDENSLTLHFAGGGSFTYTGDALAGISSESTPIPGGVATIDGTKTNGRWTFTDSSSDIVGITIGDGTAIKYNSMEIAQITTSIPEVSSWGMMALGFAGLGLVASNRGRKTSAAFA